MPISLKGFQRLARSAEKDIQKFSNDFQLMDFTSDGCKSKLATLIRCIDDSFDFLFKELQPYLTDDLPTDLLSESVDDLYEKLRNQMRQLRVRCEVCLAGILDKNESISVVPQSTFLGNSGNFSGHSFAHVKTPKFNLPSFDGAYTMFDSFWARYEAIVHNSPSLTLMEKFEYLLGHLEGSALNIVTHLDFKEENYSVAISLLKERFSNPRRSVSFHATGLLDLPSVTSTSDSLRAFLDSYNTHFYSLKNYAANSNMFELIFSQHLLGKLSYDLRDKFETRAGSDITSPLPLCEDLISFLKTYVTKLENVSIDKGTTMPGLSDRPKAHKKSVPQAESRMKSSLKLNRMLTSLSTSVDACNFCNVEGHATDGCPRLTVKPPRQRLALIKSKGLCPGCLSPKHNGSCKKGLGCKICKLTSHHTFLHFGKPPVSTMLPVEPVAQSNSQGSHTMAQGKTSLAVQNAVTPPSHVSVLMATCLIKLFINSNKYTVVRAILDSASQVSLITEHCAQSLQCQRSPSSSCIQGVGHVSTHARGITHLGVASLMGETLSEHHSFLILKKITCNTPRTNISIEVRDKVKHLILADPSFDVSAPIDCLLGADIVAKALKGPVLQLGEGLPSAISTTMGYVLIGMVPVGIDSSTMLVSKVAESHEDCLVSLSTELSDLNMSLQRFWSLEEPPQCEQTSPEDLYCEEFYASTTVRLPSGRYQVRLPFRKDSREMLGNSHAIAIKRFTALERRFERDPIFKRLYVEFMSDYLKQGHMLPLQNGPPKYFLPHHGVFKSHGESSNIRVVFNGSAKTSSGVSLNDILYTGPKLQSLISDVIARFRLFPICFVCDAQQMFRQIKVHPDDQPYQCILWRADSGLPLQIHALTTVTYGTGSAPWHALRTLKQVGLDEGENFPLAAHVIKNNTFVDDFNGGADSISEATEVRDQLIAALSSAGFTLKKWASNAPQLLAGLAQADILPITDITPVNFLGLQWFPTFDYFKLPDLVPSGNHPLTKRSVLALTASLYDPCGWISPVVFKAKHFMQQLWRCSLDWDDPLPPDLKEFWTSYQTSLADLALIKVSRPIFQFTSLLQLHGFSDSSTMGYSCVIYLRVITGDCVDCHLLASKTRVAPLKPLTMPRLELMGACLLAKLFNHYATLFSAYLDPRDGYLWTDSTIVLDWIKTPPHLLKIFVGNRVSQILDLTSSFIWRHVPGTLNPADIGSRGLLPLELLQSSLWWKGPGFLQHNQEKWPPQSYASAASLEELELKPPVSLVVTEPQYLFETISSWSKVVKVAKLVLLWRHFKQRDMLSSLDIRQLALQSLMKYIQSSSTIKEDISKVSRGVSASKAVQRLTPFVDKAGLLRARGRVAQHINPPSQCPVIVPKTHHLIPLLIRHYHVALGHGGPTLVQYVISRQYWILSARQVIRKIINQCTTCFRVQPKVSNPLMGDLPACRVNPAPPFFHTGMDFCGPFFVKSSHLRKAPLIKSYLCIFVCMCVKAVHLEVALGLSTPEFLDCLKRFMSRRGAPKVLYSDCGLNFVGASTCLQRQLKMFLTDPSTSREICEFAANHEVEFKFSCPSAPHQNGLWERAVRSAKFHLRRIIGTHVLTVPQFMSLATQVESILNSRPLVPLSADPSDIQVLTPGHFLIGRPLAAPPAADLSLVNDGLLHHHQLLTALLQRFWKSWRLEYLATLQARSKWSVPTKNLQEGDVVIVEEPNCPPFMWPLGVIEKAVPGDDGVVRQARVRTKSGSYDRPAVKLYRLPVQQS